MSNFDRHQRELAPESHLNRVLTLAQWAALNSISRTTAKRLVAAGRGPKVVQLSERRIGIREIDNAAWQAARVRNG
jgi:predicted DNA-binding transcriptional regulator AlpA